jgi:2C-methyl-D-erythritol 2,4-cyclodiphosphate synthase
MAHLLELFVMGGIDDHEALDRLGLALVAGVLFESAFDVLAHSDLDAVGVASDYVYAADYFVH